MGFWIFNSYREYKRSVKRIETDDVISRREGISTTKTIKVHDTTIEVDEKLERTVITRRYESGNKNFRKEIDDFAPATAYDPFNNGFKTICIWAIDNYKHKTCVINVQEEIVAQMLEEFISTSQYISGDLMFAIDSDKKKLCILKKRKIGSGNLSPRVFTYKDIISAEIVEDEDTITKTQRSSQIMGAVVGNVLLGGVGTIIGGLSGTKKATGIVTKVEVKIIVKDMEQPNYSMLFLCNKTKRGSSEYAKARKIAEKWYGMLKVLISMDDKEESNYSYQLNASNMSNNNCFSIADELQKIVKLHDDGVLSDEEFNALKSKIITPIQ